MMLLNPGTSCRNEANLKIIRTVMRYPLATKVLIAVGILTGASTLFAQTTIFDDTFGAGNGDSTQSAAPADPTATSTAYEYFQQGGNPTAPTFPSAGDYHVAGRSTTSSISENEALFTSSPITLATAGDYLDLAITFTDTTQIYTAGGTINIGMFNSGGSKPAQGTRLDAAGEGTGGAVGWIGYVGRIGDTGAASQIYTRPAQGAGTANVNQSQDVLFNGASGSSTFNNPSGSTVGSSGAMFGAGLIQGDVYTLQLRYTVAANGGLTILDSLYNGTTDTGTAIYSQTDSTSATALEYSYDALAFGWRYNGTSSANVADFNQILVTDDIQATPEPTTLALGSAGLGLLGLFRFRRRS
jgi:hypothetical protein